MAKQKTSEITYGKTPLGQLLFDLLFANLSDSYLARKHSMPIAEIRKCRDAAHRGIRAQRTRRPRQRNGGG